MKAGWAIKRLKDVATVSAGNPAPQDKSLFDGGNYPFFRTSDVGRVRIGRISSSEDRLNAKGIRKLKLHKAGTILLPKSGASAFLDHRVVMAVDGYVSSHLATVFPESNVVDGQFLFHALLTVSARELSADSSYPTLSLQQIQNIEITLPPLDEQRRIVEVLDKAFAAIATATANAQKNLANAHALFESRLNNIILDCGRGAEPTQLASYLDLITYGFTNPMPTESSGPYMVTAKNVTGGRIDFQNTRRTSRKAFDTLLTDKSRPIVGDVLLTKDGTLGRLAVVDRPDICINQSVALLRCNSQIDPIFLLNLLSSRDYQSEMVANAGGTTIKHIYITRVDKMLVRVPDRSSQHHANALIQSLSDTTARLVSLAKRKLAALTELKQSLLQKAFAGELT